MPEATVPLWRRRWFPFAVLGAVIIIAAGGGVLWWLLRDDAPPPVSLGDAVAQLEGSSSTTAGEDPTDERTGDELGTTTTAPATTTTIAAGVEPAGIDGQWSVDTSIGTFDFEQATGSFVGFRVEEELAVVGQATAVGRTGEISGGITIEDGTVTAVGIDADLSALTTNESRRDDRVHGALETARFPLARFGLTEPIPLDDSAAGGEPISAVASGELTIRDVTRPVDVDVEAQLADGVIVLVGSLEVEFADYGVSVPSAPVVLSAEDHGIVEMQLLLTRLQQS